MNLLVLVPLLLLPPGRSLPAPLALLSLLLAFICASCFGSVLRALLDLEADRRDPANRALPFAAGDAPLSRGLAALPVFGVAAVALAGWHDVRLGTLLAVVLGVEVLRLYRWRHGLLTNALAQAWLAWARLAAGTEAVGGTLTIGLGLFCALSFTAVTAAESRPDFGRGRWMLAHASGLLAGPVLGWFAGARTTTLVFPRSGLLLLLWPALLLWIIRALKSTNQIPIRRAVADPFRWSLAVAAAGVLWLAARG